MIANKKLLGKFKDGKIVFGILYQYNKIVFEGSFNPDRTFENWEKNIFWNICK